MLGEDGKTIRGYSVVRFSDAYGHQCSLQQSSAIAETIEAMENPGSSFVWLGVDDCDPKIRKTDAERLGLPLPPGEVSGWMPFEVPKEVMFTTRMHLNRKQVCELINRLRIWLHTGQFQQETSHES